jgi:hypothetical protein
MLLGGSMMLILMILTRFYIKMRMLRRLRVLETQGGVEWGW